MCSYISQYEVRLKLASTSFGRLAGIDALTGGVGFSRRGLLRATSQPPWRSWYIGIGMSGYRLGRGRSTDKGRIGRPTYPNLVYRLARFGIVLVTKVS